MTAFGQMLKNIIPDRKRSSRAQIGVFLTPDQLWALLLRPLGRGGFRVEAQVTEKLGRDGWADTLYAVCQKLAPRGAAISVALSPAFYSLLLVDAPPVEANELRDAVKWRVKDLVNVPLDALVVDAFPLPHDAYRGRLNMVYAAATDKAVVRKLTPLNRDNFALAGISIQELALIAACNRSAVFSQGGTALLQIEESSGAIHLTETGNLYLTRTLDLSSRDHQGGNDNEHKAERLALDVQRSLDYYESQIGKAAPARVAWLPSAGMNADLAEKLQQQLTVSVVAVALESLAQWKALPETADQISWATALGAVLQTEPHDAAN